MKKRILFVGEATPLKTGFSKYYREILSRIYSTGRFEIAEYGCYLSENDPRANNIPWKFYSAMPKISKDGKLDERENLIYKQDYQNNQFGKWKFEKVLSDFRPDYVVDIRDPWMVEYQGKSILRKLYKWILLACVDGFPQKKKWLDMYASADAIFTYSLFGKEVLEKESNGRIKVLDVISPGVNTDIFKPLNKVDIREEFKIDKNAKIIGTVMRNQPRKLYPRLFDSFSKLLKKINNLNCSKKKKITYPYLLIHTSIPDVGWDILGEISNRNLQDVVLLSLLCRECDYSFVQKTSEMDGVCPSCGKKGGVSAPNTSRGISDEKLAKIYNCMDLYVQASVCEGWGMPILEAKACGIPVLAMDWSATAEQARAPGGIVLNIDSTFFDHGTGQKRALFSQKDFVNKSYDVLYKWSEDKRIRVGNQGRETCINSWDISANKWIKFFDEDIPKDRFSTWNKPIKILDVNQNPPLGLSIEDTIKWLYNNILKVDVSDKILNAWKSQDLTKEKIIATIKEIADKHNKFELSRIGVFVKKKNVASLLDRSDKFRILYAMPMTAGDVFLSGSIITSLAKKYPNASIYLSTDPKYFDILKGHPAIKGFLPYDKSILNYRAVEGSGPSKGLFDIVYNPYILTQINPSWIHNGYGQTLLETYSSICNVKPDDFYINYEDFEYNLPDKYVVVFTGGSISSKKYSYFQDILHYIKYPVVQVGTKEDAKLRNVIDLRGKTSYGQLATVIKNAVASMGADSYPAHLSAAIGVDTFVLFGPTRYENCLPRPNNCLSIPIFPKERELCIKPCHLETCPYHCIDYIKPYNDAILTIKEFRNDIIKEEVKNTGISLYFDYDGSGIDKLEKIIEYYYDYVDEIVVCESISKIENFDYSKYSKVKIVQHNVVLKDKNLRAVALNEARKHCTKEWLLNISMDEILNSKFFDTIKYYFKNYPTAEGFALPIIEMYGGLKTIFQKRSIFRTKITKNFPLIVHNENEPLSSDVYIMEHTGALINSILVGPQELQIHEIENIKNDNRDFLNEQMDLLNNLVEDMRWPYVQKYSFVSYEYFVDRCFDLLKEAPEEKVAILQRYFCDTINNFVQWTKWNKDIKKEDVMSIIPKLYMEPVAFIEIKHENFIVGLYENLNQAILQEIA